MKNKRFDILGDLDGVRFKDSMEIIKEKVLAGKGNYYGKKGIHDRDSQGKERRGPLLYKEINWIK